MSPSVSRLRGLTQSRDHFVARENPRPDVRGCRRLFEIRKGAIRRIENGKIERIHLERFKQLGESARMVAVRMRCDERQMRNPEPFEIADDMFGM